MKKSKSVSISDIARITGVSVATVSHVINKTGRYSAETEEKVNNAIREYGYVSNNAARSLKSSASHTVGLIIPDINNDFFSQLAVTIEHYFDDHDYSLFICNTENNPDKESRYFRKLDSMRVDGIIVISCQKMLEKDIISRDIPVLLLDRTPVNNMNLPTVTSDVNTSMYMATEALIKKGCQNIVFVSSYLSTYVPSTRSTSYLQAMNDNHMPVSRDSIIQLQKGASIVQTETQLVEYINSGRKVDGIICTSDNQAIGAMTALKRLGLRVPEDAKVFGFDNQFQSRVCTPTLSTIERHPTQLGEAASRLLLDLIKGKKDSEHDIVINSDIIERESTAGSFI